MLRGPWLKARKSSKLVGRGMGREGSRPLKNPGLFSPYHPSKTREIVSMGWGLVAYGFLQATYRFWAMGRGNMHIHRHPRHSNSCGAEPNGFLLHLLSHSDTVSSARPLHWLVKHSQSTPRAFFWGPSAKETRRLVTSEVQPCGGYGHWWSFCIPWLSLLRSWRNGSASSLASFVPLVLSLYAHTYTLSYSG